MSVWLVLFSCIFIIFTTLSIGVSERARRLALMRALGLGRMQIALLIAGEGIFLCIPALLGGLAAGFFSGVPAGGRLCLCTRADLVHSINRRRMRCGRGLAGFHHSCVARFPPVSAGSGRSFLRIHREGEPCSCVVCRGGPRMRVSSACGPAVAGPGGRNAQMDIFLAGLPRSGSRCAVSGPPPSCA